MDAFEPVTDGPMPADTVIGGVRLGPDDILADDWEIQEPTVTITRKQFYDAVMIARRKMTGKPIAMWHATRRDHFPDAFEVAIELGLEEIAP